MHLERCMSSSLKAIERPYLLRREDCMGPWLPRQHHAGASCVCCMADGCDGPHAGYLRGRPPDLSQAVKDIQRQPAADSSLIWQRTAIGVKLRTCTCSRAQHWEADIHSTGLRVLRQTGQLQAVSTLQGNLNHPILPVEHLVPI